MFTACPETSSTDCTPAGARTRAPGVAAIDTPPSPASRCDAASAIHGRKPARTGKSVADGSRADATITYLSPATIQGSVPTRAIVSETTSPTDDNGNRVETVVPSISFA